MGAGFQSSGHSIQESTRGQNHDRSVSRLREILAHEDAEASEFAVPADGIGAIRLQASTARLVRRGMRFAPIRMGQGHIWQTPAAVSA